MCWCVLVCPRAVLEGVRQAGQLRDGDKVHVPKLNRWPAGVYRESVLLALALFLSTSSHTHTHGHGGCTDTKTVRVTGAAVRFVNGTYFGKPGHILGGVQAFVRIVGSTRLTMGRYHVGAA